MVTKQQNPQLEVIFGEKGGVPNHTVKYFPGNKDRNKTTVSILKNGMEIFHAASLEPEKLVGEIKEKSKALKKIRGQFTEIPKNGIRFSQSKEELIFCGLVDEDVVEKAFSLIKTYANEPIAMIN